MSQHQNQSNPFKYPLNPSFGQGIFRRRLRLQKGQDQQGLFVLGEMEDCNHAFQCKVYHDGNTVLDIQPQHKRIPLSTCDGAGKLLLELIGSPLGLDAKQQYSLINPIKHCTHWLDLTLLCIQQATRDEDYRDYLIDVPDETNHPTTVSISRNGELIHRWQIHNWIIQQPEQLAGNTLYKGFAAWTNHVYSHDADLLEAAFVLQKGYFVSRARQFDINKLAGEPANRHAVMQGACYSYSEPQVSKAVRTAGTVRDFTDCPEQLLAFK